MWFNTLVSGEYACRAADSGDVIVGVVNLDMIGYVDALPESIDLVTDPQSEWLVDLAIDCADAYVPMLATHETVDETWAYSDHASFWRVGYDAFHATEDAPVVYPAYHTTGDTLGNLTQWFATDVVKMGLATVAELAEPDTMCAIAHHHEITQMISVHPNPFKAVTTISFALRMRTAVDVSIYNVEGRLVKQLAEGRIPPGSHDIAWDGTDRRAVRVSPGVYFTRLKKGYEETHIKVIPLD